MFESCWAHHSTPNQRFREHVFSLMASHCGRMRLSQ